MVLKEIIYVKFILYLYMQFCISYSLTAVVSSQTLIMLTQNGEMKVWEFPIDPESTCLSHAAH